MFPTSVSPSAVRRFLPARGFVPRIVTLLVASTLVLVLAGSAVASIGAPRPMLADASATAERSWFPGDTPDVALLVAGVERLDPRIETILVPGLGEIPGVTSITTDRLATGRTAVYLSIADDAPAGTLDAVTRAADQALPDAQVSLGGRLIVDRDLVDRINSGVVVAVTIVLVLLTIAVASTLGLRRGLMAAGVVGLSAVLGGAIGSGVAGPFDGSLASTALPAVLVALLVSSVLTFRLFDWFEHPQGADPADVIRRAVSHLLPELLMLFTGLLAAAAVTEMIGAGRSPATVVAVGGAIAAVVTLASLPALLATLPDTGDRRLFRLPAPDGRDLPLTVLAGLACFLLVLGLFAIGAPSERMLDSGALPQGEASRRVAEQLVQSGGDPSDAIVATIDAGATPDQLDRWATLVSELPLVGWVETAGGRYEAGVPTAPSAVPARFATQDAFFAIVSPAVAGRSEPAQQLVDAIEGIAGLPTAPALSGVPVDAAGVADAGTGGLWLMVAILAIGGGVAAYLLLDDLLLAGISVGLRMLGTAASLGVYAIVAGDPGGRELQVLALVVNVGVALFELGFLRRIAIGRALDGSPLVLVGDALRREGRAAILGLGVAGAAGLAFVLSDISTVRQLGAAVVVGVLIEVSVGVWLLRPAVLGARVGGTAPTPTARRRLLRSEVGVDGTGPELEDASALVDPGWRRIVAGLLRAEFDFQAFPETADLPTVFVEETPLFSEVSDHNRRLLETGLRVAGAGPEIRAIHVITTSSPVTLSVTVDHPIRYLVAADGRQIGQRAPETREGMLWLVQDPSGRYRIAEAVDLGPVDTSIIDTPLMDTGVVDLDARSGRTQPGRTQPETPRTPISV